MFGLLALRGLKSAQNLTRLKNDSWLSIFISDRLRIKNHALPQEMIQVQTGLSLSSAQKDSKLLESRIQLVGINDTFRAESSHESQENWKSWINYQLLFLRTDLLKSKMQPQKIYSPAVCQMQLRSHDVSTKRHHLIHEHSQLCTQIEWSRTSIRLIWKRWVLRSALPLTNKEPTTKRRK